ncbi:MAG: asparagine synthase (glutamine-hydrolyzing) [Bacteroidales bacterium]|nr:asparagine synthase (glutamine-hydrolyzing) [Bacteroidales bacterium]
MCGITGFFSLNINISEAELQRMSDVINYRGPDAYGYYYSGAVGLGHRRLSIIDLSVQANQPMWSHNKRYVAVYNGEIYNFKEIAKELEIEFNTTSDTEVIIEAFVRWGPDFVNKCNGMFAIAIFDTQLQHLFLFRDRMGIKPIFYFLKDNMFVFASELKCLLQIDAIRVNMQINKKAINEYLYLGYIPEPLTIYNNIYKFPSASYAVISENKIDINKYWNIEKKINSEVYSDYNEAKTELRLLVEKSVKYRLISDVPYGTFLSGGIDSSLVTAVASKLTDKKLKTFSIGFSESKFNEAKYAKNIADFLGTEHYEFIVSYKDALELADDMTRLYDEPYSDSSAIPTMLVSKLARQYVTMTLSGDGGDELFHGYGAYNWAERFANPMFKALRYPAACLLSLADSKYKRAANLFRYDNINSIKSNIFSQEQYLFTKKEIRDIINKDFYSDFGLDENFSHLPRRLNAAENQALFDLKYYLKDDLLVKVDRASMKYSLETRVPLLDYNIVEFALNLAPGLKINKGIQKYLLKELLYNYIPSEFFRRPKWGFAIPLISWLKNELKYLTDAYLSESVINKHAFVDFNKVDKIKNLYYEGKNDYLYNRIWALIVLHKWAEDN